MKKISISIALLFLLVSSIVWYGNTNDERILYLRDYSLLIGGPLSIFMLLAHIRNGEALKVSKMDCIILALFLYTVFRTDDKSFNNEFILKSVLYFILYLAVRNNENSKLLVQPLNLIIIFFYWVLSSIGVLEFILYRADFQSHITYNFSNSGVFGNYLALGFPILLNSYFLWYENANKYAKGVLIYLIVQMIFVIILTTARACWVGTFIASMLIILTHNTVKMDSKKLATAISTFIFFVVTPFLLKIKWASAMGRLLIYKVSFLAIENNFLLGYGNGRFASIYNQYQGQYFSEHSNLRTNFFEWNIADSMRMPCNEYLQVFIEMGFIGFLLTFCAIAVFIFAFFTNKYKEKSVYLGFFASIISILVCAFFSYPFQETPICLLSIVMMGTIVREVDKSAFTFNIHLSKAILLVLVALSSWASYCTFEKLRYKKEWQNTAKEAAKGTFNETEYEHLYSSLSTDSKFLYNYGCELSKAGQYEKSIHILDEAMKMVIDEKLLCFQAENYYQTKQFDKTEAAYILACNIVPSRFFPKFFLMDYYIKTGSNAKAIEIGQKMMTMPEKIPNQESRQVKSTVKHLVDSLKTVIK